jgi:hypothetical protein
MYKKRSKSSGLRKSSSSVAGLTPRPPEPMSEAGLQKLADLVGWKHDRGVQDMRELLSSVQMLAATLKRRPEKAVHMDLLQSRRAFQGALDCCDWLDQRSIKSLILAGYQGRHIAGQVEANAPANLLQSDLGGLERLLSAIDFAIEMLRPRRGRPRIEQMIQVLVDEVVWTYRRFIDIRFRGVRATKTASPGPDFVREAMRLLMPCATKAQVHQAMRRSKTSQITVVGGSVRSAAKPQTKRRPLKNPA